MSRSQPPRTRSRTVKKTTDVLGGIVALIVFVLPSLWMAGSWLLDARLYYSDAPDMYEVKGTITRHHYSSSSRYCHYDYDDEHWRYHRKYDEPLLQSNCKKGDIISVRFRSSDHGSPVAEPSVGWQSAMTRLLLPLGWVLMLWYFYWEDFKKCRTKRRSPRTKQNTPPDTKE